MSSYDFEEMQEKGLEDKVNMLLEEKQAANVVRLEYDSKLLVLQTQLDNQKKDTQSAMDKVDAAK